MAWLFCYGGLVLRHRGEFAGVVALVPRAGGLAARALYPVRLTAGRLPISMVLISFFKI